MQVADKSELEIKHSMHSPQRVCGVDGDSRDMPTLSYASHRSPTAPCHSSEWQSRLTASSRKHYQLPSSSDAAADHGVLTLRKMPVEILEIILLCSVRGHLDLSRIMRTCRQWRDFAREDLPWKRLSVRAWGNRSDIVQIPIKREPNMQWMEYYKARIQSHVPFAGYMINQQLMTVSIRSILINWLLAVIDEFQQEEEDGQFYTGAQHQTVAIFDHYCAKVEGILETRDLQMIGAACAVMALHEGGTISGIDPTFFNKASFYTDGACTAEQVVAEAMQIMEVLQLSSLPSFETSCEYIDVLLTAMQKNYANSSTYCLAHYLGELSLQAETSLKFSPLIIGASAYALACHTLGWSESIWMPIIRNNVQLFSITELQECMSELQGLLRQALNMLTRRTKKATLPHVVVKYSRRDKQHVAKVILTDSPWPVLCPHGCDREFNEVCAECEGAIETYAEEEPALVVDVTMHALQANDNDESGESEPQSEEASANRPADAEKVTPRDFAGPRGLAHTPINALLDGAAPPQLEGGRAGRATKEGGSSRDSTRDGGEVGERSAGPAMEAEACEEHAPQSRDQGLLQDVSFGTISEGNDNSFSNATFDVGGDDRRTSFGSVLGKVFEEEEHDAVPVDSGGTEGCGDGLEVDFELVAEGARAPSHEGNSESLCELSSITNKEINEEINEVETAVSDISIDSSDSEDEAGDN